MDIEALDSEFEKQCGEVFLSKTGNFLFVCTLCEMKYQGFQVYADHIMKIHYFPDGLKDNESVYSSIGSQIENQSDEPENVIVCKKEIDSSVLDGFQLINEIEFDAPVPDNCGEIEKFIANLQNKGKKNKLHTNGSMKKISKSQESKSKNTSKVLVKTKTAISKAGKYRCKKCNFVTPHYSGIMMHLSRHIGKKRHFCSSCDRGFYVPSELRVHMRTHTGERPYLCTECGQTFKTSSTLSSHAKRCKNIRDVQCPKCEKKFFDNKSLRYHMVVHSEQRSYQCLECNATFKLSKTLRNHMKIHENKQEFKCRYCPSSFNQKPGLISHIKNKHQGREK